MREILFRIKNYNDWYYGYPMSEISNGTVAFVGNKKLGSDYYDLFADATTLEQFTGLCDKNGNRVFDGDILKSDNNIFIVKWLEDKAKYVCAFTDLKDYYCELNDKYIKENFVVCGNIHDNPELLEQPQ